MLEDYTGVRTINVHVYPSKSDHDQTLGLCGTLNENRADDFMDRDGNLLSGEREFNTYWRYFTHYMVSMGVVGSTLQ